jgi:hypothetical protein
LTLCACLAVSVIPARRFLRADVFVNDALVHQYWMWQFRDPQLFTDPLTAELRASARYPGGYEALFRFAAELMSPITFGEWLGIALSAVSAWLVFLIVRGCGGRPGGQGPMRPRYSARPCALLSVGCRWGVA